MVHSLRMKPETASASLRLGTPATGGTAEAEALFSRAFQTIRPRTARPQIEVRFSKFANVNSFIQLKHGRLEVRISDALQSAPASVIEALAFILISKLYRKPVPKEHDALYRKHLAAKSVRRTIAELRQQRGHKQLTEPQGSHYDLIEVFEEINFKYFHGLMPRPNLGWSRRASRQTLGHYDAAHHTIVINQMLDSPKTPRIALEFVLYHEMLHVKHPVEHRGTRRCVHTKDFQEAERLFENYDEAQRLLKSL